MGRLLQVHQVVVTLVLGSLTIVLGLLFLGALYWLPFAARSARLSHRAAAGLASTPMLGVLFRVGWTPCIGPTLAAVLSLSLNPGTAGRGALLAFAYSLGLGLPFIAGGLAFQRAVRVFGVVRRHSRMVRRTGGITLIIVGVLQVSGAWTELIAGMQGLVTSFQVPLSRTGARSCHDLRRGQEER